MITEKSRISLGGRRVVIELAGLSTDTKPLYWECIPQPAKEEFEANASRYYLLKGKKYVNCSEDDFYAETLADIADTNTSATDVTIASEKYLGKTTNPMELVCVTNNATKSVTAKHKSFTTSSVTLAKETLFGRIRTSGTHNFIYDGSKWKLNNVDVVLADYGLAIADGVTLTDGDKIAVTVTVKWQSGGEDISLSAYGITVTGSATDGDSITISVSGKPNTFYEAQQLNGSVFVEMDTKKTFMFNEDGVTWVEQ